MKERRRVGEGGKVNGEGRKYCLNIIYMGLLKFIDLKAFLLSFLFGLFVIYIVMPDDKTVYVYPTPDNVDIIQYRDVAENCFAVKQEEVECPADKSSLFNIPMQ